MMVGSHSNSTATLTTILENLYKKTVYPDYEFPLPVKVIDTPDLAKAIFLAPDVFVKNYPFFDMIGKGRISANGQDWVRRAAITQPYYSQATHQLSEQATEAIYVKHFMAYAQHMDLSLYDTFVAAALEVVSKAFGLPSSILWPPALANRARLALIDQQAMAWEIYPTEVLEKNQQKMRMMQSEIATLWRADRHVSDLLDGMAASAKGIKDFDAVGELLQNVFASTETTASSMLWMVECLSRHSDWQEDLSDEALLDYFIDEVLRLFPPVPYVTRVCLQETEIEGMRFEQNEAIIISIIGVHTHRAHWQEPLEFKLKRPEFVDASYPRHAFIPFISGPRMCAGMKLAKQEVKCGVRALLKAFAIQACAEPRRFEYGISSKPGIRLEPYLKPRMPMGV